MKILEALRKLPTSLHHLQGVKEDKVIKLKGLDEMLDQRSMVDRSSVVKCDFKWLYDIISLG